MSHSIPTFCHCCRASLPVQQRRGYNLLDEYCDVICFAAANTLTRQALVIWRANAWKLDAGPKRAVT